jgi:hypothetical protein
MAAVLSTAVLILGFAVFGPAVVSARAAVTPRDALTLVRQALAALEVTPPDVAVATERVIKALFAQDTRGVDMPRVREAAQALGEEDTEAAAAYLMAALRSGPTSSGGVDMSLWRPVQPRVTGTPGAYALLAAAALLIVAGALVARR